MPYARVRDQEGFANQLRLPRKTLEMERRILVLLRNAGCNAVPHPNDFVYDANPAPGRARTPRKTARNGQYDDVDMLQAEPYLLMEMVRGQSLEEVLKEAPEAPAVPRPGSAHDVPGGRSAADLARTPADAAGHDLAAHLSGPQAGQSARLGPGPRDGDRPGRLPARQRRHGPKAAAGGRDGGLLSAGMRTAVRPADAGRRRLHAGRAPLSDADGPQSAGVLAGRPGQESAAGRAARSKLLEEKCKPALRKLIERCLDPEPEKRFADVGVLQKTMQKLLLES